MVIIFSLKMNTEIEGYIYKKKHNITPKSHNYPNREKLK